ncbi:MAG: dihydrofolate reductase family protein [Actinomycetota bacterium]|nr:dihydrofolate reductase family protein [Actinomycetota bacterium]
MKQLLPDTGRRDLSADELWGAYGSVYDASHSAGGTDSGRGTLPRVVANMVTSLDGAATIRGRSGPLSSEADQYLFKLLRAQSDAVVVGAGTVAVERYRRVRLPGELAGRRKQAGLGSLPPLVVVSRLLALDFSTPPFTDPPDEAGGLIVVTTPSAPAEQMEAAAEVADRLIVADGPDFPADVTSALGEMGLERVLCEGGPRLLHSFLRSGLVSHVCLTVAPLLAGAQELSLLGPEALERPLRMDPVHLLEQAGWLFMLLRVSATDA